MEVERRSDAGWGYLLEGHNTLPGLLVLQLKRGCSVGRHVPYRFLSWWRDKRFVFIVMSSGLRF